MFESVISLILLGGIGLIIGGLCATRRWRWFIVLPVALIVFVGLGVIPLGACMSSSTRCGEDSAIGSVILAFIAAFNLVAFAIGYGLVRLIRRVV